jgi:hypothetical protein
MDHILPIPTPDWNNPTPTDGPTPEEVDAFARLHKTADGLRAWIATAYASGLTRTDWTMLGERLTDIAKLCTGLGASPDVVTDDESTDTRGSTP